MTTLLQRNDAALAVSFTPEARAMKIDAMTLAVEIESVTNPDEQALAVEAQKALDLFLKAVETSRVTIKAPVLDYGRKIDQAAKDFVQQAKDEITRISRLVGDYQAIQLAKQRDAEAARNAELSKLAQEKHAELAKAESFEQREEIHERFQQQAEAANAVASRHVAPRVEGQRIQEEWEFEVTDPQLLARMHPNLVKIEPRRSEIREELKLGHKVHGIEARKVVVAGVRTTKGKELVVAV